MNTKSVKHLKKYVSAGIPVVGAVLVGGLLLVLGHSSGGHADAPASQSTDSVSVSSVGQDVVRVQTEPVRLDALQSQIDVTGTVSFPADESVKISPRLQGRVRQVYVREGDYVKAGQPLALLDSVDAATAQTTYVQNENALQLAKIALDRNETLYHLGTPEVTQAQAAFDQAKANTAFSADALAKVRLQAKIGGFTQQPLADARTAYANAWSTFAQAQANLDAAQPAYDRMVKLVGIGVNSKADLEAAQNTLTNAKVAVAADQQVLDLAKESVTREEKAYSSNLYADQQVRAAQNTYQQSILQQKAAGQALQLARAAILTNLEQAESDYKAAQENFQNSRNAMTLLGNPQANGSMQITSPISGVVVERDVNPGQVVDQSQMTPWQMFVVSNNSSVWVEGDVYESEIAAVRPGQPVTIHVDAYPTQQFFGKILYVAPTLNSTTRAVQVRAVIPNSGALLKNGMFAEMTIHSGNTAVSPVIPVNAVQHDADSDYVYVAQGQGVYVRKDVELGTEKNGSYIVKSGLQPGQRVVTEGAIFLGGQVESD